MTTTDERAKHPATTGSKGARLLEQMSPEEEARAAKVEAVLPALRAAAEEADRKGEFERAHIGLLREAGLLGLIVPTAYGGMGGTLRDLVAATFAMGSACPSTALAFFFHCSSASRGLLPLEAISAGLFDAHEAPEVKAFGEKLLRKMGTEGKWLANFASESVKTSASALTITTEAVPVPGGFRLSGVKSFGCATGVADEYLVTAKLAGTTTTEGLGVFFVKQDADGVSERQKWDAIGMRATATHGIVLKDVFVKADDALALPGAFLKMMQVSRGSFVGNQLAVVGVYLGAAQGVYDYARGHLTRNTFKDTGRPIGESPVSLELLGRMLVDLTTGYLWLRRQLELETSDPPMLPKADVVQHWRMCKGEVCEASFRVAMNALKACGTGNTGNSGPIARGLRDLCMGLVQAFPAETGRLEAARYEVTEGERAQFSVAGSK
jgi:alkylation response protein AidB-like acyl-CoA dehydrogenase